MTILSRRSIQKIIYEVSEIIGEDEISEITYKLNKENTQSLDTLWEIIVIKLLSRFGSISYEIDHGGRTKPDIFFKDEGGLELIADITCISDQNQDKNNDVNYFNSELSSVAKKVGIETLSGFDIRIEDDEKYKDKKVCLKLPAKNTTRHFIESKLKPILKEISNNKEQPRSIKINENEVELSISYNPTAAFFTSSYPSFTVAKSLTNNPIYNRLKRKSKQLKDCGYPGLKGVIICDGGCSLIVPDTTSNISSHSIGSIINNFLQQQDTISFVIAVYVEEDISGMIGREIKRNFSLKYVAKDNCKNTIDKLTRNLISSTSQLPSPISTPKNASWALKNKHSFPGNTFYGGCTMSSNKITISARTLLDLITGNITSEKMINDHNDVGAYLKNQIDQGYKLRSISLSKIEESDDDWVELSFEDIFDPSVSKYTSTKA